MDSQKLEYINMSTEVRINFLIFIVSIGLCWGFFGTSSKEHVGCLTLWFAVCS